MSRLFKVMTPAAVAGSLFVAVAGAFAATAPAPSTQPSDDVAALKAQVQALESKVNSLENKQSQTQADVTAAVQQVLQDADRHSQSMDVGGVNGGFDPAKGAYLQSEDGNFYFHPGFIFQFRGVVDHREHSKASGGPDNTDGFEVRRAKFYMDGNLGSKDLTFKVQWQDGNNGGAPTLEYAWGQWVFQHDAIMGGNLGVKAGQFKDPIDKEEAIISDTGQLMVERSLANAIVGGLATGPLVQGVDLVLVGNDTPLHVDAGISDGDASGNTDFTNNRDVAGAVPVTNYGAYARADWKVFGDWADTSDLTGKQGGKNDLLDVGGGVAYSDDRTPGANVFHGTVDAQYLAAKNWTIFGALYGDHTDFRNPSGTNNSWGAVVEGGYFWTPAIELVGRYSLVRLDPAFKNSGRAIFHEIGAGVDYYLGQDGALANHAKLSLDVNWLPRGTPTGATGLDYQAVPNGKSTIAVRGQFQLYY